MMQLLRLIILDSAAFGSLTCKPLHLHYHDFFKLANSSEPDHTAYGVMVHVHVFLPFYAVFS